MYKIETHAHTMETSPCGRVGAAEMMALYKEKGYSCVIITDHYSVRTFIRKLGARLNILPFLPTTSEDTLQLTRVVTEYR